MTIQKAEWISLNEAVELWLEMPLNQPASQMIPREVPLVMHSAFSEALRVPEFSIKGAPDNSDSRGGAPSGELVEIPALYFRIPRTFYPDRNSIEPHNDSHPVEYAVEAIKGGPRHPYWVDVHVHRESFAQWLTRWLRNHLVDELSFGRLSLDEARDVWAKSGTGNLEGDPDPANFDPMTEVFWTLPMAVAWIAWRDPKEVVRHWDKYRVQCGHFWKSGEGWIYRNDEYNSDEPASLWVNSTDWAPAKERLWAALQSGEVKAFGKNAQGDRLPIDAFLWRDHGTTLRDWKKVSVLAKDVLQFDKPPAQEKTVISASTPIQKSLKKPKMPPDVMKDFARNHMLANKDSPTTIDTEIALLETIYPNYRKPTRDHYRPSRKKAAAGLNMRWWYAKGPKEKPEDNPACEPEKTIEKPIEDNSAGLKYAELSPKLSAEFYEHIKIKQAK